MFLGIDIGTSGVKVVLVDGNQQLVAQASEPLVVTRPSPLWSEQDPASWWHATCSAVVSLRKSDPIALSAVRGIGLAGQMHGATLLDEADKVLRPAILWNDGRSSAECEELEKADPRSREITGNLAMPGFTAPKLLWVRDHEPEVFAQTRKVLLPKDYVRLLMTGEHVSEMSDAAGTLWLDVGHRDWSDAMLEASGLNRSHMARLVEGSEVSGVLRSDVAAGWGMGADVVVAGGAGDNAAGAVGIGVVAPGQAFLSVGTSGVMFVANDCFAPNPAQAVHAFCHCLPGAWHQMSVILSAASCLTWLTKLTRADSEAALLAEAAENQAHVEDPLFLPYLSGERTPHNNPHARGVFFGLGLATDRGALCRAVLEGVAFAFADGQDALLAAGAEIDDVAVIGGGARSAYWGKMLASILGRRLTYHEGAEAGPAFGAARLARLSVTGEAVNDVCIAPPIRNVIEPDRAKADFFAGRRHRFIDLYSVLEPQFTQQMARQ